MTVVAKRLGFRSAREVADFFGVSERLTRANAANGIWPSYRIGGRRVFDLDELVELVKGGKADGRAEEERPADREGDRHE